MDFLTRVHPQRDQQSRVQHALLNEVTGEDKMLLDEKLFSWKKSCPLGKDVTEDKMLLNENNALQIQEKEAVKKKKQIHQWILPDFKRKRSKLTMPSFLRNGV